MAVISWNAGRWIPALAFMWVANGALAEQPLRVEQLQRCGNLLTLDVQTFCLEVSGLENSEFQVKLNGTSLPTEASAMMTAWCA